MESESSNTGQSSTPMRRSSDDDKKKMESESSNSERMSRLSEEMRRTSVENLSEEGKETMKFVKRETDKFSTFFDNTNSDYTWLRSGWIAEERRKSPSGRLTRYYYDPQGSMYSNRSQVEFLCERS